MWVKKIDPESKIGDEYQRAYLYRTIFTVPPVYNISKTKFMQGSILKFDFDSADTIWPKIWYIDKVIEGHLQNQDD